MRDSRIRTASPGSTLRCWWELGGDTNIDNGVMLCYFHHRLVHEGKWTIKIDADATIKWFKPDGTYYDTSHPRPTTTAIPLRR